MSQKSSTFAPDFEKTTNNVIQTATYRKQTGIHIPLLHARYDSNESLLPMYGYVVPITHTITQSYIPVGNRLRGFFMSPPMCSGREHTIIYTKNQAIMGVDIFFHAEVRKKDKWQPLIWYRKPQENLESWRNEKIEDNGMVARYYLYGGRAYHYDDVLEDLNASHGFPEDMSDELRARLPSDKYITNGYFSLKDLTHYIESQEKKMLANLLQSRDYQLVQHMQRIEKAVLKQPMDDQLPETYLYDYSIEQIYEDYLDEMYRLIRLSEVVYYLAEQFHLSTYEADIRIIYQMY